MSVCLLNPWGWCVYGRNRSLPRVPLTVTPNPAAVGGNPFAQSAEGRSGGPGIDAGSPDCELTGLG